MSPISDDDLARVDAKPRSKGSLPYLPNGDADPEQLRDWLTLAFRPPRGWRFERFTRQGRQKTDACEFAVRNGREEKTFRVNRQSDLTGLTLRQTVFAVGDGFLRMPHLTAGEVEDVWAALCTLGRVMAEVDEADEAREWIEALLPATAPLTGFTLVPDGRRDALMAIRAAGEFTKADAMALMRGGDDHYQQRPTRFVDAQTQEQWLRVGETAAYLRWVLGVEPLSFSTLHARLQEIGVSWRRFEDSRPPHPKLNLYQLTETLIAVASGAK